MNECFFIGKIIKNNGFKFILNKKNKSKIEFELKLIDNNILKIVAYDEKTIEYVILHEFCHLKYKIRTKNFWKMIGTYMPNYEQYAVTLGNIAY